MSGNIAQFLKFDNRKGKIAEGYDADITIWNPAQKFMVNESMILHLHKITPYVNLNLQGVIEKTYVNGTLTFDHFNFIHLNKGKIILNTI
jgi:allantoinase